MTKQYYECHVTFNGFYKIGEAMVGSNRWKYSRIDGDPVVGAGVRQYATKHFNARMSQDIVWQHVLFMENILRSAGLKVERSKIELVIRDERYNKED